MEQMEQIKNITILIIYSFALIGLLSGGKAIGKKGFSKTFKGIGGFFSYLFSFGDKKRVAKYDKFQSTKLKTEARVTLNKMVQSNLRNLKAANDVDLLNATAQIDAKIKSLEGKIDSKRLPKDKKVKVDFL